MSEVNTVAELQELWLARPGPDAAPTVVAAWYARKARVLQQLAAAGSELAAPQASAAYRRAQALTAGMPGHGKDGTGQVSVRTDGRP